jgi:hypothetical protein
MAKLSFIITLSKLLFISLGLLVLAGCSTARDPKSFTPYASSEHLMVKQDFTYSGKRGLYNFKEGLREGTYKAELQDEAGTYYRGPGKCVFTVPESHSKTFEYQGGLWVPRDGGLEKAKIYSYFSAEDFYANNPGVSSVFINVDDGKIFLWDKVLSEDSLKNLEWRKSNEEPGQ